MSVLFCHDHRFVCGEDGKVYSTGQYSSTIVARYERIFGEMRIAGREQPMSPKLSGRLNLLYSDRSRFVSLPNLSSLKSLLFKNAEAYSRLEAAILDVDAVIVRLPSEIGILAATIARKHKKPLIVEVVACVWDGLMSHGSPIARLYAPLAFFRMRRVVAHSDWTLYVTKKFLQSRYPSEGQHVCASNVQLAPRDILVEEKRLKAIRDGSSSLTFGMIAAMFHNEKRVDVAIRALAIAAQSGADTKLEIVGAGDTSTLQDLASKLNIGDRVRFLGVLEHGAKLFGWLDGIDVYVQTSFQEGLPRALIEALSRATPSLASSAGGTDELVTADCLHKRGDATRLATQMLDIRNPDRRAQLARENFKRAAQYAPEKLDALRWDFWSRFCTHHGLMANAYE